MKSLRRPRAGFTLVELLTVVVIIGMLLALIMPAVFAAQRRARQVKCINNQQEIVKALGTYESAKQRYPALTKASGGTVWYNWAIELFPYLGANDLWNDGRWLEKPRLSPTPTTPAKKIPLLICPDDAEAQAASAGLSYVANLTILRPRQKYPAVLDLTFPDPSSYTPVLPKFENVGPKAIRARDIKSLDTTPIISERVIGVTPANTIIDPTNVHEFRAGGNGSASWMVGTTNAANAYGVEAGLWFLWPPYDKDASAGHNFTLLDVGAVSSGHAGGAHVTFASGSTVFLPDRTEMRLYDSGPY